MIPAKAIKRRSPLSCRLSFLSLVISTKRSAWRDLINAPLGASGKPQRFLDYARNDKWGWTLEMTEGVDDNFVNDKIKERMIRIKWTMVAKVLKLTATIITTIVGTLAVQSCAALL